MATRTKAATPERSALVEKEPTDLHTGFVEYIAEQTGYDADLKSVQLATILRMDYQRSEANQSRLASSRTAREEAEAAREQARAEREAKREAKAKADAEKAAAKKEADAKAKSAPAAKKAAPAKKAAAAPAKKAAPRRRAAAKPAASEDM